MKLRVHHLLCSALYVGKGYSDDFCENMRSVVTRLWESDEPCEVFLTCLPDGICAGCPNLSDNGCLLDGDGVATKDALLARALGLETERKYDKRELFKAVGNGLTREMFERSCCGCEWYKQGLCDYGTLIEKYREYTVER